MRDHSLLARDFARGQLPRGPQGIPGPPGSAGPSGTEGPKGDSATKSFGVITPAGANPTIAAQRGVVGVAHGAMDGEFEVTFAQDVSTCVAAASIADPDGGMVSAAPSGGAKVAVQTRDRFGQPTDEKFTVAVFC